MEEVMTRLSGLLVAGLLLAPAVGQAQMGAPRKEFGVDIVAGYVSPDGGDGFFGVTTPFDVRVGFLSAGKMSFEPRFSFAFVSDNGAGDAAWSISPVFNLLFKMGNATHNRGTYFTVGAGIDVSDDGAGSSNQFNINAGIGMRRPSGNNAATRIEGFFRYDLENSGDGLPSIISFGARLGYSFFK
jgi:hypothetical protein